jgi:hypothetical protein
MLLPAKHVNLSESLLGLSGLILSKLNKPKTIDSLWREIESTVEKKEYPSHHPIENLFLAIEFLYLIGEVNLNEAGEVHR